MNQIIVILWFCLLCITGCAQNNQTTMKLNSLTPEEEAIILHKATEKPFSGELLNNKEQGIYICKHCNAPLYSSEDKFESRCGWPSFDDEIAGAVKRVADKDGRRTEIICANCGAHLGHVFLGEEYTDKNIRHCVNSLSMKFIPQEELKEEIAYFASGCFWGTEYHFDKAAGVLKTAVGFMGGHVKNPTYEEVCQGNTGHLEVVQVIFNPEETSYDELVQLFFETHNFTQIGGQGPDIGAQYESVIFYTNKEQEEVAQEYIDILKTKGYTVATALKPSQDFWKAEIYHQKYYAKKHGTPYCHIYHKIF